MADDQGQQYSAACLNPTAPLFNWVCQAWVQTPGFLRGKTRRKNSKKPAPNLIQFQFVVSVIIKDVFMFTAYNE